MWCSSESCRKKLFGNVNIQNDCMTFIYLILIFSLNKTSCNGLLINMFALGQNYYWIYDEHLIRIKNFFLYYVAFQLGIWTWNVWAVLFQVSGTSVWRTQFFLLNVIDLNLIINAWLGSVRIFRRALNSLRVLIVLYSSGTCRIWGNFTCFHLNVLWIVHQLILNIYVSTNKEKWKWLENYFFKHNE